MTGAKTAVDATGAGFLRRMRSCGCLSGLPGDSRANQVLCGESGDPPGVSVADMYRAANEVSARSLRWARSWAAAEVLHPELLRRPWPSATAEAARPSPPTREPDQLRPQDRRFRAAHPGLWKTPQHRLRHQAVPLQGCRWRCRVAHASPSNLLPRSRVGPRAQDPRRRVGLRLRIRAGAPPSGTRPTQARRPSGTRPALARRPPALARRLSGTRPAQARPPFGREKGAPLPGRPFRMKPYACLGRRQRTSTSLYADSDELVALVLVA